MGDAKRKRNRENKKENQRKNKSDKEIKRWKVWKEQKDDPEGKNKGRRREGNDPENYIKEIIIKRADDNTGRSQRKNESKQ